MDSYFADAHLPQLANLFARLGRPASTESLARYLGEKGLCFRGTDRGRLLRVWRIARKLGFYATTDLGLVGVATGGQGRTCWVVVWAPEVEELAPESSGVGTFEHACTPDGCHLCAA